MTRKSTGNCSTESSCRKRRGAGQKRERMESRRVKRGVTRKECKRLRTEFEVGRFHGTRFLEHRQQENVGRQRSIVQRGGMHEDKFLSSWLMDNAEGKAEEMEKMNKDNGSRRGEQKWKEEV